ncbi:hypothetical protein [Flavobacterium algoritolerans]|jgi:hypothetical protein|uniref:Uncharacterized protein n=1 Tax=Flavobacterium algoritolerans TaxID=3041254 RepID=A0ABT6VC72_9FLAO|nr:hypothetical protein [Flavobacterium algoritolerans]MDI5895831.1 hypothetical protein [Flavobacterium algoritolerans]
MNKVNGIINGLKFVLKYGVYITAIITIVKFAIDTFEAIEQKDAPKTLENE